MTGEIQVSKARLKSAFEDRALYLAFLLRSFQTNFGREAAEQAAREAIFSYGQAKGQQDGRQFTAENWVAQTPTGEASVFDTKTFSGRESCEEVMATCPLVDAWRNLGCSPEEIDTLCDIAMEVDRGRAAYHGLICELPERIGQGDKKCRLVLRNR